MVSEARALAWPALTYESLPWQPAEPAFESRRAMRRHRRPYEAGIREYRLSLFKVMLFP